ncbi:hypothetical protein BJX70DRAFT_355792 [Aspergillus crustosus]
MIGIISLIFFQLYFNIYVIPFQIRVKQNVYYILSLRICTGRLLCSRDIQVC